MTTVEHTAFASPLSLLQQWRDDLADGDPLRELVVLGYTLDLAFLERFCIPQARQLGARVTVLADAGQSGHAAVDVRFAGRSYLHGVAALPGAFHPKLVVLLGDEHVWIALGSGNPTMAGWGHNHELWWVLRGHPATGPRVQDDLGSWLERLQEHVRMPSWIADTLAAVGRRVRPVTVDDSPPDVTLLHTLDRPIARQLPEGPTTELRLAAPFVDPSGRAVRELITRAQPGALRVALQQDLSSFDGRALVDAASGVGDVEFRAVDDERTLHGKLIEWSTPDGRTTAVVGSPNLTTAALLGTVADGHNCELAVLAPVRHSLLPAAEPLAVDDVLARTWNRSDIDTTPAGLRLLGCLRTDVGLAVELVSRHPVDVTVETSVDGSPGSWAVRVVLPAASITISAVTSAEIEAPEVVGGAVRIVALVDDRRIESAPVFVTDVRRCRPRTDVGEAPRLRQDYDIDQLILDENVARRFSQDLRRLLEESARARTATPRPLSTGLPAVHADVDRWQRFLDVVAHSVGASLVQLAFPGALPAPAGAPMSTTSWTVADVGDESELAEGETEAAIEEMDTPPARQARRVPRELRARYRGWMGRWVTAVARPKSGQPPLPLRMTVTALYLELLAAGVWGVDDGWRDELADLVTALVTDRAELSEAPEEAHGYLGSLVAVCLALLLHDASLHGGAPADVVARRGWEAGHEYAATAERAIVDDLLLTSTQADAQLTSSSEVASVVALAQEALVDPHAEALAGLKSEGVEVERRDGYWMATGEFRNTMRVAARVVTDLADDGGVAVVATNSERTTLMLRRGSELVMADMKVRRWRTYSVRPPSTPKSLFGGGEGVPSTRITAPLSPVPAAVRSMVVGLDVDQLVRLYLTPPLPAQARTQPLWDW